jgi:hypothetical protein
MNHTFGARLLKRIDQRRKIANIAANHGDISTRYSLDVIRSRRKIEKRNFVTPVEQVLGCMRADQTGAGN